MLPANAPAWIDRLLTWLEPFESAFGHVAQRGAFRRYLLGVLGDSPRKSMSAMLARVSEPGQYQALQHFVTDAPWSADGIWRRVRQQVPAREGVLIFDGTSFPKQGVHSVGSHDSTAARWARSRIAKSRRPWRCGRARTRGSSARSCICRRTG